MQNEKELTRPQQELENALQNLRPAPMAIERDRLIFRAGQTSGRRRNLIWPTAAAVLAAMLAVSLAYRPAAAPKETVERIVYVPVEQPAPERQPVVMAGQKLIRTDTEWERRSTDYFMIRDKILAIGMEALPETQSYDKNEPEDLLRELRFSLPFVPPEKSKFSWASIIFGDKS